MKDIKDTFTRVMSALGKGEQVISSKELAKERLEVCSSCPRNKGSRCEACGCFIKAKAHVIQAKCPEGHWDRKLIEKAMLGEFDKNYETRCCS